jgi:hypothetical protein
MKKCTLLQILIWFNLLFGIAFTNIFMQDTNWRFITYLPWLMCIMIYWIDVIKDKENVGR